MLPRWLCGCRLVQPCSTQQRRSCRVSLLYMIGFFTRRSNRSTAHRHRLLLTARLRSNEGSIRSLSTRASTFLGRHLSKTCNILTSAVKALEQQCRCKHHIVAAYDPHHSHHSLPAINPQYTSSHLGRHAVSREAGDLLLKDETMWLF